MNASVKFNEIDIPFLDELPIVANQQKPVNPLRRVTLSDAVTRPQLDFVLPGLLRGSVGMIVGQGAIGKSFLSLEIGLSMATGRPVAGGLWDIPKTGKTLVIMGEDDSQILQERLYWLRNSENLSEEECKKADLLLDVRSGRGCDMRIIQKTRDGYQKAPFFDTLMQICEGQRLVVIDPLLFLNGGSDENDNGAAAVLMSFLYQICEKTGATIVLLHHVGKGGSEGREEWASARGASAFTTSVRWQINMSPLSKDQLAELGIDESQKSEWVFVKNVKANYGQTPEPKILHRGRGGVLECQETPKSTAKSAKSYQKASQATKNKKGEEDEKFDW